MSNKLNVFPLAERPELVAAPVLQAVMVMTGGTLAGFQVAEINADVSDTQAFCDYYGYDMTATANTMIVEGERAGIKRLAVVVVAAADRADINGLVRKTLEARRVSLAPKDEAVRDSGMEFGSITVIGLADEWPKLIDARVLAIPNLLMGGGLRQSKLIFPGQELAKLPGVLILENLVRA